MNAIFSKPFLNALLLAAWLALPVSPLWAHDGEVHEHDEASVNTAQTVRADEPSRATNQTEAFEIVAVLDKAAANATLTLYLDDFATNEPVRNAKVEVESGIWQAVATMQAPGVYTVPAPSLAKPGRHPLTISIDTPASSDLIDVALQTGDAHTDSGEPHAHAWLPGLKGALSALVLIAVIAIVARLRWGRRRQQEREPGSKT